MLGFACERSNLCLTTFTFANVPGDFGGADHPPIGILDGRNRQRNVDVAPVLTAANSLIVLNALTPPDTFENRRFFVVTFRGYQEALRIGLSVFKCF
jgi:hypothetical protein